MVSACLLGQQCKYDGGDNRNERLLTLLQGQEKIPICPEVWGGLPTPRNPVEIKEGKALTKDGKNVTKEFLEGSRKVLAFALKEKPELIILQSRSPSCGVGMIYDGTFTKKLIKGNGILATLLQKNGFTVMDVDEYVGCNKSGLT